MGTNITRSEPRPAEPVAAFSSYEEAEAAVNALAERMRSVEGVTIVAGDLRFVEHVTGRQGYAIAAASAGATGAVTGAFVGFILGIFNAIAPMSAAVALAFWGLLLGGAVGALVGVLAHGLGERRRDFASVRVLTAGRYDVLAPPEMAAEVRRVIADTGAPRAA